MKSSFRYTMCLLLAAVCSVLFSQDAIAVSLSSPPGFSAVASPRSAPNIVQTPWWDADWRYRVPVTVAANGHTRVDKPAEVNVNFGQLLAGLGETDPFDPNSIRVIETTSAGQVTNANVSYQFDRTGTAVGKLIFMLDGVTNSAATRYFWVYFDVQGRGYSAPSFPTRVSVTDTVNNVPYVDEGQASFLIETENATYSYHIVGGGFSSIDDVDGLDWVKWSTSTGATGEYRGIPNIGTYFHPGYTNSTSEIIFEGPLKATIRSTSNDSLAEITWEIYSNYARATISRTPAPYWVLYEGTPGGMLDAADYIVRSDGSTVAYDAKWCRDTSTTNPISTQCVTNEGDWNEEWLYFVDPNVSSSGRALFVVHHENDTVMDSYRKADGANAMTIWGFGRNGPERMLSATPSHFTYGLMDDVAFANAASTVRAAYKDLSVSRGAAEVLNTTVMLSVQIDGQGTVTRTPDQQAFPMDSQVTLVAYPAVGWHFVNWTGDIQSSQNPYQLTMNADKTVVAHFAPDTYTLTTTVVGDGMVARDPNKVSYSAGDLVELTAVAGAEYEFDHWEGRLAGTQNPATLQISGNSTVTAVFVRKTYTLTIGVVGQGAVDRIPNKTTFQSGESVNLTATPAQDWRFSRWRGDVESVANPLVLQMEGNKAIEAQFDYGIYQLDVNVDGPGSVTRSPDKEYYVGNEEVTLQAWPDSGARFVGWSGSASGGMPSVSVVMTGDKAITAKFVPLSYTVDVMTSGEGTVSQKPLQPNYQWGDVLRLEAFPMAGWRFSGWSGGITDTSNPVTVTITNSLSLVASFVYEGFSVDVVVDGSGTVVKTPVQPSYALHDTVRLEAVATPGWRFTGWSGDVVSTDNPLYLTDIGASSLIVASFIQEYYTISVNTVDSRNQPTLACAVFVEAPSDPAGYLYGENVQITVRPDPPIAFLGWQGDLGGSQTPTTLIVDGNQQIDAICDRQYRVFLPLNAP